MSSIHASLARSHFIRNTDNRVLGGVCSGLARRYRFDPWAVRALFVVCLFLIPGSQILVYPIAWLLMPDEARAAELTNPALPAAVPSGQVTPPAGESGPVLTKSV